MGALHPVGSMYLYVLSFKPVSFLTFLSKLMSLAFILLVGSFGMGLYAGWSRGLLVCLYIPVYP